MSTDSIELQKVMESHYRTVHRRQRSRSRAVRVKLATCLDVMDSLRSLDLKVSLITRLDVQARSTADVLLPIDLSSDRVSKSGKFSEHTGRAATVRRNLQLH